MNKRAKILCIILVCAALFICVCIKICAAKDEKSLDAYIASLHELDNTLTTEEINSEEGTVLDEEPTGVSNETISSEIAESITNMQEHDTTLKTELTNLIQFTDDEASDAFDAIEDIPDFLNAEAQEESLATYAPTIYGVYLAFDGSFQDVISMTHELNYDTIFECSDDTRKHYFYNGDKLVAVWTYGDLWYVYDCTDEAKAQGYIQ